MVLTLMIITRKLLKLEDYITIEHIESMNKVILLTGTIVGVAYLTELFIAWYSGYVYEQFAFYNRATGIYWWSYFGMMACNVLSPQIFWVKKYRQSVFVTFVMSVFVNIGMVTGILGGALVCTVALDISPSLFITRLHESTEFRHFFVGMAKAPVFAFLIALTGCRQGLSVSGSAESVGRSTTKSVVQAIFLVIMFDALFALMFRELAL